MPLMLALSPAGPWETKAGSWEQKLRNIFSGDTISPLYSFSTELARVWKAHLKNRSADCIVFTSCIFVVVPQYFFTISQNLTLVQTNCPIRENLSIIYKKTEKFFTF